MAGSGNGSGRDLLTEHSTGKRHRGEKGGAEKLRRAAEGARAREKERERGRGKRGERMAFRLDEFTSCRRSFDRLATNRRGQFTHEKLIANFTLAAFKGRRGTGEFHRPAIFEKSSSRAPPPPPSPPHPPTAPTTDSN